MLLSKIENMELKYAEKMLHEELKKIFARFDNEEIDYNELADEFCRITETKIHISFKRYGQMRWDKGTNDYRNIYTIRCMRNGKSFSAIFGDSIYNTQKNSHPTKYDVLACLTKYNVGDYEEFCSEFGYDVYKEDYTGYNTESRTTWRMCQREYNNVIKLWGDVIEELQEIR